MFQILRYHLWSYLEVLMWMRWARMLWNVKWWQMFSRRQGKVWQGGMVNVKKFGTQVACQKCLDKQCRPRSDCFWRSSLIRVCTVCYSDKHFVNSSPDNKHFIWQQKEKCLKFYNFCEINVYGMWYSLYCLNVGNQLIQDSSLTHLWHIEIPGGQRTLEAKENYKQLTIAPPRAVSWRY